MVSKRVTREAPTLRRQARVEPTRVNVDARTFEAVFSTGSKGRRSDWFGPDYFESLVVSEAAIDLARLKGGAALLNNHRSWGDVLEDQLGVVEDAWITGAEAWCRCRVSKTAKGDELLARIKDGEIRHISVGYQVHRWTRFISDGELDHLQAELWEPFEVSLVTVPFDAGASVRAAESQPQTYPCEIVTVRRDGQEANTMVKKKTGAASAPKQRSNEEQLDEEVRSGGEDEESETRAAEDDEAEEEAEETRAAEEESDDEEDEAAPESSGSRALEERVVQRERKRVRDIQKFARGIGLTGAATQRLIDKGRTLAELTESGDVVQEYTKMGSKAKTRSTVVIGEEAPAKRLRAIEDSLLLRMRPSSELTQERRSAANDFRGLSLREVSREVLEMRGQRTRGWTPTFLAQRALHTSSDLPKLLENIGRKVLRAEYAEEPQTFAPLITIQNVPDFKTSTLIQVAGGGALKRKNEKGEYQRSTLVENAETYKIARYGEIIGFTGEMLVNDDLGGLGRVIRIQARRVRQTESQLFWELFAVPGALTGAGPVLADGNGIFHASRNNTITRALSEQGLGEARAKMRMQKDIGGDPLNTTMRFLVVPPSLETKADQLTTLITANESGKVNVFAGRFQVIVETRLEAVGAAYWWGFSAPSEMEGVIMGGLESEEGPQFDTREAFDTDGVEFKVRLDKYAKAIDFRGFLRSTGAVAPA